MTSNVFKRSPLGNWSKNMSRNPRGWNVRLSNSIQERFGKKGGDFIRRRLGWAKERRSGFENY